MKQTSAMRFRIVQRLPGALDRVEAAFVDRDFLERLAELPKLGRPTLLDQDVDGDLVHQRVRYAFAGHLSAAVTAVVDPARLTWIEDSTLDRRSHRTTFSIVPDHYRDRLACEGTFTLQPDGEGTRRTAEGDLRVRFPLVGGKVERAIVSGLEEHAELEADVMSRWLEEHEG